MTVNVIQATAYRIVPADGSSVSRQALPRGFFQLDHAHTEGSWVSGASHSREPNTAPKQWENAVVLTLNRRP
jgi:hypothetical protein